MHGFNCAEACGILVSLTKDQTQVPCIGRQILKPLDHQRSLWIIFMSPVYLIPLEHLSLSQFLSTQFTSMGVSSIPVVYIQATFSHAVCYLFLCVWVPEEISFFLFSNLQPRPKPLVFNDKFGIPGSDQTLLSSSRASGTFYSQLLCKVICLIQP